MSEEILPESSSSLSHKRRSAMKAVSLSLAPLRSLLLYLPSLAAEEARPNLIFLLTDDQSPYMMGYDNPEIKTPVMDALAQEGVILKEEQQQESKVSFLLETKAGRRRGLSILSGKRTRQQPPEQREQKERNSRSNRTSTRGPSHDPDGGPPFAPTSCLPVWKGRKRTGSSR